MIAMSFWRKKRAQEVEAPVRLDQTLPAHASDFKDEKSSLGREVEKMKVLLANSPTTDSRKVEVLREQIDSIRRIEERLREEKKAGEAMMALKMPRDTLGLRFSDKV